MTSRTERRDATTWPLLLLALPAFVAVWSGWVGLGTKTGFGKIHPLPGTPLADWSLDTCITLPIGVEVYGAYALSVWLSGRYRRAAAFAQWSAIGSLAFGALGQVAYHLMEAAGIAVAPWPITMVVSCLPVAVLGMGAALAHLIRADVEAERSAEHRRSEANERERAEAERTAAEVALQTANARAAEANAIAERMRIEGEREQSRTPNVRPGVRANGTVRKANANGRRAGVRSTKPADDLARRRTTKTAAFDVWAEREATNDPMPNDELAALLGVGRDAARTQANRWRRANAKPDVRPNVAANEPAEATS